jgi:hypothetical protein
MTVREFMERLKRARAKRGAWALPKLAIEKLRRAIRARWQLLFNDKKHLFVFDGEPPQVSLSDGMVVERYDALEQIPNEVMDRMREELGDKVVEIWLETEFKEGSVLWILFVDDKFVVRQLTRRGKFIPKWYLPLAEEDFIFMAAGTFPEYRGRGLSPLLKRYILAQEMRTGVRVYGDVKASNVASMRALQKIGFRHIGIKKNYWEGNTLRERVAAVLRKIMLGR